jgi:thiol-disulfide isomerase/thioredoxin
MDGTLTGKYYSGKTWEESWTARKNENASLPDAEKLTYLKEGYDRITFTFPDVNGNNVSLDDPKYKNKVVVLQLFGTWCPNCMDETKFLAPWYDENKDRGVAIIGLAYERKADFTYASNRVKKMIDKMKVNYDFVIAGTDDKAKASETLPMLNQVIAFPTTIFIGKDGKVKKIHTGFSGPGTGIYYDQFKQHFNETINELLAERTALN